MRYPLILLSFIWIVHGEYSLTIYLRRLDVGQGFLANGTHCTDTWNLGDQCNLQLKLGVCLGPLNSKDPNPCPNPTPIDLGTVTTNSNAVDFSGAGTAYKAWTNPSIFPNPNTTQDAIYAGFALNVEIQEARGGLLIDSYQQIFDDGSTPNNFLYYSHPRNLLDPTMLSVAWKAVGDLPTPAPPPTTTEAPTPTHTTVTEPSTEPPTTPEPITATDCHEVKRRTEGDGDGVYQILINDTLVDVYCTFGTNVALTHIQGRGELDNTSFNVKYLQYQSPFGSPNKGNNFWLGLDNMHQLTSNNGQSYSLMIEVCCGTQSITKQYYTNVTIGDSTSGYMISGNATLGVGLNNDDQSNGYGRDLGKKFVTFESWGTDDNEYCMILNDDPDDNKYSNGTGGWWFGNCRENLNGQYYDMQNNELEANCTIKATGKWPKGSGIELVTKNVASPVIDGVSYTRARMALYRGTATPLGLKDFCS